MDKNEKADPNAEQKDQKSVVDRLNQIANDTQNVKKTVDSAQKGGKALKNSQTVIKGAARIARGAQAAYQGVVVVATTVSTAVETAPAWIVLGIALLIIIVVIIILGGSAPPSCQSLTTSDTVTSPNNPVTLTLAGCAEGTLYDWQTPSIGGSFSTNNTASTVYTPPDNAQNGTSFSILVRMCNLKAKNICSFYSSPEITIGSGTPNYPGISYNISGPNNCTDTCHIQKGEQISYNIDIAYDSSVAGAADLNKISAVVSISSVVFTVNSVTGTHTTDFSPNIPIIRYLWKLSDNATKNGDNGVKNFHFEVKATPHVDKTQSSVNLNIEGANASTDNGDLEAGATSPPTSNTCNDTYKDVMEKLTASWPELGKNTNFGDPVCSYKPSSFKKVLELVETKHPENIPFWMDIAQTEGGIMTVGNLVNLQGKTIHHSNGPYGKFQMSRGTLPGQKWTHISPRGDVPWQKQIENAVGWNNERTIAGRNFDYWGTARCLCYFDYYRKNNAWCGYIKTIPNVFTERRPYAYGGTCSALTDNKGKEHGWVPDPSKTVR